MCLRASCVLFTGLLLLLTSALSQTTPSGLLERAVPPGSTPRPSRFMEGDRGEPILYRVDLETLPRGLTPEAALGAIHNAFAAWSEATGLRFLLGDTTPFGKSASDFDAGENELRVQCHDRHRTIAENGVLGIGGSRAENGGFLEGGYGGRISDQEFHRTVRGYVILNHRHPSLETLSTFEEVLAHEIGHLLGFAHSSEAYPEPDERLRESLLYARVHADGRGASLNAYDLEIAQKAYPLAAPPAGVFPTVMRVITHPGNLASLDFSNRIRLPIVPFGTAQSEAVLHAESTENFGTFSIEGDHLIYSPHGASDEAALEPETNAFHDRAIFRINTGPHGSAWESVRVIELSPDSHPSDTSDGLPDRWMLDHFGNAAPEPGYSEPHDDPDGDGSDNLTEFQDGTDPLDADSVATLSFATSASSAQEDTSVYVTVTMDRPVWRTVRLPLFFDGSAQGDGVDYQLNRFIDPGAGLWRPPGRRSWAIALDMLEDGLDEIDETVGITLLPLAGLRLGNPSTHLVTIVGNAQPPVYEFAVETLNADESSESPTVQIVVHRSGNVSIASEVSIFVTPDPTNSAASADDYDSESLLLAFAPGQTSATAFLEVIDDNVHEPDEQAILTLGAFQPFGVPGKTRAGARLTIKGNDEAPLIHVGDTAVNEAAGSAVFEVGLSEISGFPVTVHYATDPGSAAAGSDYEETTGQVVIPPGEKSGIIHIPLLNDLLDEDDESFHLRLFEAQNAVLEEENHTAAATILDNDPLPSLRLFSAAGDENAESLSFVVLLTAPSGRAVTFGYTTHDGSATSGDDYVGESGAFVLSPGTTRGAVPVVILQDYVDEGDEKLTLEIDNVRNAIMENSVANGTITNAAPIPRLTVGDVVAAENAAVLSFPITLSIAPQESLTLSYQVRPEIAQIVLDDLEASGDVTIPAGSTEGTITVGIHDDALDEDDERFLLEVTNHVNSSSSAITAVGTIVDDDPPSAIILESATAAEADGAIPVTIRVSPPSGREIRFHYATRDGSARNEEDYVAVADEGLIPPLTESLTLSIPLLEDGLAEPDQTFFIDVLSVEQAWHDGSETRLNIIDDDAVQPFNLTAGEDKTIHPGRLVLKWQGLQGNAYQIQQSRDLRNWTTLPLAAALQASGAEEHFEGLPQDEKEAFFRIVEIPLVP